MNLKTNEPIDVFWFRRDLRLEDNHALFIALSQGCPVLPIFIFDKNILSHLDDRSDARVSFIREGLEKLNSDFRQHDSGVLVFHGDPVKVFDQLSTDLPLKCVYSNEDYEPYAIARDQQVKVVLKNKSVNFAQFKDQVIFNHAEVLKDDGKPYTVFTPYFRKWKSRLENEGIPTYASESQLSKLFKFESPSVLELAAMGFKSSEMSIPPRLIKKKVITAYERQRNFPSIAGTSRLGIHLRFGTVSVRRLVREAQRLNDVWLSELAWREFFMQILFHFPHTVERSFRESFDHFQWRNNEAEFERWCNGQTGYPIVDAGMRELNNTGFMHNRVRMITASFLCKHLLVDWRWGERYFAKKLLDFDLASNVGNWQWVAGSGCDAAPYFRIFNPHTQTDKFDKDFVYVSKWVPEWNSPRYDRPIVNHVLARARALKVFSELPKKQ